MIWLQYEYEPQKTGRGPLKKKKTKRENIPSWKRSLSSRSITVGGGTTIEDLRLSELGFSTATSEQQ